MSKEPDPILDPTKKQEHEEIAEATRVYLEKGGTITRYERDGTKVVLKLVNGVLTKVNPT